MRLYVYVVVHDSGFAPNLFHGYCTLATCKPRIRQCAEIGDWIIGLGSARNNLAGKLVYAMKVEEALSFDDYWNDPRFRKKRPRPTGRERSRCGDNAYRTDPRSGDWIQAPCYHSGENGSPSPYFIEHDTIPPRALISKEFVYFGRSAVDVPEHILFYDNPGRFFGIRGHRCNFPRPLENAMVEWLKELAQTPCIHDLPTNWDSSDDPSCSALCR